MVTSDVLDVVALLAFLRLRLDFFVVGVFGVPFPCSSALRFLASASSSWVRAVLFVIVVMSVKIGLCR